MLNTNYKATCGSLLHSGSSPSVGSLCIYLYPSCPLIISSTEKQEQSSAYTSNITQVSIQKLCTLNLGAVVYSNLFYMCLIKLSSWNHQSLFCQWCFLCYFAKVYTLQSFPPYGTVVFIKFIVCSNLQNLLSFVHNFSTCSAVTVNSTIVLIILIIITHLLLYKCV